MAAGSGGRKPGAPRDAESEVWSRRVRDLVGSGPGNRLCFECGQRGVTYVDITLGSFVCTGCSGALRGLNPPHRVKSISMTTFTEADVLFLQARGNEACQKVWLGSFDPRTSLLPDSRDPQKVKEFLQEKYEKKRWYVSPDQAKGAASLASQSSTPEVKPQQTLLGDSGGLLTAAGSSRTSGQPRLPHQRTPQPAKKASTDLLADIGGDPFAAPQPVPAFAMFPAFPSQAPAHAAFANFDAFGCSPVASAFGGASVPFHTQSTAAASRTVPGGYSFAGGAQVSGFGASPSSHPGSGIPDMGGAPGSLFGSLSQPAALPPPGPAPSYGAYTNPFAPPAAPPARPSTNPFQPNGTAPGSSFDGFAAAQVGQPVGISTNPFMTAAPSPPFVIKHPATNPFL
ncbi:arf-GAP domain and FG repeat-containing protein 2 isoform X1 [Gopherus evgoodei]|uniref:arf-GAP domain and FG repeat-containing protein 2 isoform X1 n=1 Tax=Gopherus evgoodei TaxID=1825980 RepID=UPI0011D008A6|nr:arf-GAP domain and FG repeat-containing protein 2 isoform X1 [Gopherus evgoodei]